MDNKFLVLTNIAAVSSTAIAGVATGILIVSAMISLPDDVRLGAFKTAIAGVATGTTASVIVQVLYG